MMNTSNFLNITRLRALLTGIALFVALLMGNILMAQASYCRSIEGRYLIFLDKSGSMSGTTTSIGNQTLTELMDFLGKDLENGNRIKGYFLHEKTLSSTPFIEDFINIQCPQIKSNMGTRTKDDLQKQYTQSIRNHKKQILVKLKESIELKSTYSTINSTDIWSTFELMSRFFKAVPEGKKKWVVFLSDMKESSKQSTGRNFDKKEPKNKQEAELWAKEDLAKIKSQSSVDLSALKGVRVYILFPDSQLTGAAHDKMRYYWEPLFKSFGIMDIRYSLKD